jgi:hypothetical protein
LYVRKHIVKIFNFQLPRIILSHLSIWDFGDLLPHRILDIMLNKKINH